jgi:GT2 family glycosyltransferase
MQHFHEEVEYGESDAMQAYCMTFRREALKTVGLMREAFRFYRNLDIDYSFQFKDKGYRIVADNTLPLVRHEHRQWTELDDNQRDELSRKNFGRFLKRWGDRPDLLITSGAKGFITGFHH